MRDIRFRLFGKNSKEFLRPEDAGLTLTELQSVCDVNAWHVMQFTGLKTTDGVEIYEGDILRVQIGGWFQEKPYVVKDLRELYFETEHSDSYYRITGMEVIGNIFENPELVEVATNGKS